MSWTVSRTVFGISKSISFETQEAALAFKNKHDPEIWDEIIVASTEADPQIGPPADDWLIADLVTAFNPDEYSFEWTADYAYFRATRLRWTSDSSYATAHGETCWDD